MSTVAEHVPAELVVDFDPVMGPEVLSFPPTSVSSLRDEYPIFYTPYGGGYWVLTRFADIRAAFQDAETFPQQGTISTSWSGTRHIPLRLNPPEHHAYRKMLLGMFSPRQLSQLEPLVRQVARERIAALAPLGQCNVVEAYSAALPAATFCGLLGLSADEYPLFHDLSKELVYGAERTRIEKGDAAAAEQRASILRRVEAIITEFIPKRRAERGTDIISFMLDQTVDGRPLTDDEIVNIATLMFFAGTDSTAGMISYSMAYLASHPEHRDQLTADPQLIPTAADELIRVHGFHHIVRDVAKDVEIHGVTIHRGERILLHTGGANHDPAEYEAPDDVRFDRKVTRQVTFGAGIHRCLGATLARLELTVAIEEFHAALPDYHLTPGEKVGYLSGQQKVLPNYVPITYTARSL